jgi:hypothetical protein
MLMPSPEITVLPNDNVTKVEPDAYKLGPQAVSELGPFIPQERTCRDRCSIAVWCQQRSERLKLCRER